MSLRPFFKYFGSKWMASNSGLYPAPIHETIVEPFAGAAGYSTIHYEKNIILIDNDKRVIDLWNYIIDTPSSEIRALPLLSPGDKVYDLDICEGAKLLISCWINTSPFRKTATARVGPDSTGYWGKAIRERVASQAEMIRHWEARYASFLDVKNIKATWAVDPPYSGLQGHYKTKIGVNYFELAAWCKERNGQVFVCEKEGANWLPFVSSHKVDTARHEKKKEVIWIKS